MDNANKRTRRVGTITLGVMLIAVGVLSVIHIINPSLNMITILKLSPIILIALGIEILIAAFVNNSDKIRYDGVSIILCVFLICASLGMSAVMTVFEYFNPMYKQEQRQAKSQLEQQSYELLSDMDKISDINISINYDIFEKTDVQNDKEYADIHISLKDDYDNQSEFSQDCASICSELSPVIDKFNNINIESYSGTMRVYLNGAVQKNYKKEDIEKIVIDDTKKETPQTEE